jgi:hypothetical protein
MEEAYAQLASPVLESRAYDAFRRGSLSEAARCFERLLDIEPEHASYHYMQGLVHKYRLSWPTSLAHNLRAQALSSGFDEAAAWNAGIAATALGDWREARRQWASCGIALPDGDGPIEADFGVVSIRLNAWDQGETLFARRIDPVRAQLLNVPLPESGYRCGDIVLHDGASTGERLLNGVTVPVFNALACLKTSDFRTYTAFVRCGGPDELAPLAAATAPGVIAIEDWTDSLQQLCLRCSYGSPHRHAEEATEEHSVEMADTVFATERSIGIAAQSRHAAEYVLSHWTRSGLGRHVHSVEWREFPLPRPVDGLVWWRDPDETEDAD